ncbi:MAG TPA: FAD-linked oxidase C-terminal domain-containing protein [Thermohalobaculum sp.]|nr:FAD-linked oxidase C-terminal domain-containing protein [Thermohalobaculum sp.]
MEMPVPNRAVLERKGVLVDRLTRALGADWVIHAEEELRAYECDALTAYRCPPLAVALPGSTEEVAEAVRICAGLDVPIVPRGAGTSLSGGSLPTADSVVIGVSRLRRVLEIDLANRCIRVEAGMTNLAVTEAVQGEGFFYAPDPSSQLACAIAGNVAMNSGGAHCLKYGVTTNNLMGVRMVTAAGEIVEIGGPHLEPPGYDLLGVICGSEGQFGLVTEATLRILPAPEGSRPVLMGFDSSETAGACVADIIRSGVLPVAIEFMDRACIQVTEQHAHAGYPMDVEALLIVEVEGSAPEIDEQLARIKEVANRHAPSVLREATSEAEAKAIWLGRKAAFGAMGQLGDYICLDGTVPVGTLPEVLRRMGALSQRYGLEVANVFHAGDGNLHPLILFDANAPGELERAEELGAEILKLCVDVGGCLTGEHGVGVEKRDLMAHQYGPADLEQQMAVKDVFDPRWLLNPAKVFPLALSEARRGAA